MGRAVYVGANGLLLFNVGSDAVASSTSTVAHASSEGRSSTSSGVGSQQRFPSAATPPRVQPGGGFGRSPQPAVYQPVPSASALPPVIAPVGGHGSDEMVDVLASSKGECVLVRSTRDFGVPTCLELCPMPSYNDLLAIGREDGHVVLGRMPADRSIPAVVVDELNPEETRPVSCLAWNTDHPNLVAVGYKKLKAGSSLLLYDVQSGGAFRSSTGTTSDTRGNRQMLSDLHVNVVGGSRIGSSSPQRVLQSAATRSAMIAQMVYNEGVVDMQWFPDHPHWIVVGTHLKWLRTYDVRGDLHNPASILATTRSVKGVRIDPNFDCRLAVFSEDGLITIYDTRRSNAKWAEFDSGSRRLRQIEWCPSRAGYLASISDDESCVKLWDVWTVEAGERMRRSPRQRVLQMSEPMAALSWAPSQDNQLCLISTTGKLELYPFGEDTSLSWSPHNTLAFNANTRLKEVAPLLRDTDADISTVMYDRLQRGYGSSIDDNADLMRREGNTQLRSLWEWMVRMRDFQLRHSEGGSSSSSSSSSSGMPPFGPFVGLLDQFREPKPSEVQTPPPNVTINFRTYYSQDRMTVLDICDWASDSDSARAYEARLTAMAASGQCAKAAALALFHGDLSRAIRALRGKESSKELRLVAMSLAGFQSELSATDDSSPYNSALESPSAMPAGGGANNRRRGDKTRSNKATKIWKDLCLDMVDVVEEPYLKAAFAFLTGNFERVAQTEGVDLRDRIAFACRFLRDDELPEFVEATYQELLAKGDIMGVMLTGVTPAAGEVFQAYIDATGDIQTVALLISQVAPRYFVDPMFSEWVDIYRELLDQWRLWHHRARFDCARLAGINTRELMPPQAHPRCTFCSHSLTHTEIAPAKLQNYVNKTNARRVVHKPKISSCPTCRKPLPRCAICLQHLGCTSTASNIRHGRAIRNRPVAGSSDISQWMSFCLSCRHSVHVHHGASWFESHRKCPVSDCNCQCMSLEHVQVALDGDLPTHTS